MCAMQRNFVPNQPLNQQLQQQQSQQQQQPQQPRYHFRWPIYVGVPLVVVAFLWFVSGIEIAFAFADIMRTLGVVATNRYVLLACLGIACVTILLIVKSLKNHSN